jgi:menaquinone-dependent protoporphyrinogen IX oxidase
MAKILVVYYSRTGHTRRIAQELAARCGADLEEIRDPTKRAGVFGFMRCGFEAIREKLAPIAPATTDVGRYDLVVLGTPVWASHVSSPMRSFVKAQAAQLKRIAVFCTQGGNGGPKVVAQIAALCGKDAVATLVLNEADIEKTRYAAQLDGFAAAIAK